MNGAPDWQDGECCFRCRTQFTLVARKHHCRNCGNIFCAKCSSQQIPLPKLNLEKSVRVCDGCYEKIAGKNEEEALALGGPKDKEPTTKTDVKASSSASSSNKQSNKSANASAPSEQELKEEEELQLALALSLSETPTKVSFPDIRKLEENTRIEESPKIEVKQPQATVTSARVEVVPKVDDLGPVSIPVTQPSNSHSEKQQTVQPNVANDIPLDRDRELYYYINEVQSTLEIFNNRINACKLRNRPISNDSAVQSLFLKLNGDVQPKITEYIKTYEEERAYYERLQDKLSQISDARAALDDLREEHQEKLRQQAAEAERLRQTQLATKLEAMRQKKTQMMQYQRELALQRIREQEMMLSQNCQTPPSQYVPGPSMSQNNSNNQDQFSQPKQPFQPELHSQQPYQLPEVPLNQHSYGNQWQPNDPMATQNQPPTTSYSQYQHQPQPPAPPQQQQHQPIQSQTPRPVAPPLDYASIARLEQQYLPKPTKPDEDTPLISFDD